MTLSRRWAIVLGIVFVASLALNVLVGGMMAGRWAGHSAHGRSAESRFERFVERFPEEARPAVRDAFRDRRGPLEEQFRQVREARGEAVAILEREPFDEAALRRSLDAAREGMASARAMIDEGMIEAARALPPEARGAIGERWRRRP